MMLQPGRACRVASFPTQQKYQRTLVPITPTHTPTSYLSFRPHAHTSHSNPTLVPLIQTPRSYLSFRPHAHTSHSDPPHAHTSHSDPTLIILIQTPPEVLKIHV